MKPFNPRKRPVVEIKVNDIVVHGDVVVQRIEKLPDGFDSYKRQEDNTVAWGEMTGHVHQLSGEDIEVRVDPGNFANRFIKIAKEALLEHQEHEKITLPPGVYKSFLQQEYDPFTKKLRQVQD